MDDPRSDLEAATVPSDFTDDPAVDLGRGATLEGEGEGGRYEDLKLLGRGGMGEVRLCRDRRFGRDVAVKVLRPGRESGPFLREAVIQGQLEHPAIVPIYDLGTRQEGDVYFAMKRVRGVTLRDVIGEERAALAAGLPPARSRRALLSALSHVCLTIDYAHGRGVIHCDLKPANVMLGDFGEVYVLDWGVARVAAEDAGTKKAGGGTPGYMSPEQAKGEAIDARSDVYALGAILFEVLTLTRLHDGPLESRLESTEKGADATILGRFPRRDVAPELEELCVRATARDRQDRLGTARELHDALERFLDGDRDLEKRRALSKASVEKAEAAFRTAKAGGNDALLARAEAMREIGRALAFDPESQAALALFGRIVAEPPDRLPDDAEAELARDADASERRAALNGAGGYLFMLAGFGLVTTLGIRSWAPAIAHVVFAGAAGVLSYVRSRADRPPPLLRWLSLAFGLAAVAMLTRVFGPLFVAPGLASTVGVAFAVYVRGRARLAVIGASVLGALFPAVLEALGWIPRSLAFENGSLVILPQMTDFPVGPTVAALVAIAVSTVAAPALLVGRTSDALVDLKRRYSVREWQLRQLVPVKTIE